MFAKSTYTLVGLTLEAGEAIARSSVDEKSPAGRPYPPTVMPGVRLVQVQDEATGRPVPAGTVAVWLREGDRILPWGNDITDAVGNLRILLPPWSYYGLKLIASSATHVPTTFLLEDNFEKPSNEVSVVKLKRGKTIGGIVHDSMARPVSNALLSITSVEGNPTEGFHLFTWYPIQTDARGRWSVAGGENLRGLEFRVSHPDFVTAEYELGSHEQREPWIIRATELVKGEATIQVVAGHTIAGQVTGTNGKALTNASVACFLADDAMVQRRANTDSSGQFSIAHLEPGDVSLIVSSPEHAPALIRCKLESADLKLNIQLNVATPLRVKVQGADGTPTRSAYLLLVDWQRLRWIDSMHQTTQEGIVTFTTAPLERATYLITGPGMTSELLTLRPAAEPAVATLRALTRGR